jgi:Uma2 family endonuclease
MIKSKGVLDVPDIIIEILSPSNSQIDYEKKKLVYEKYCVEEYFIVKPNTKSVDSFFLKDNKYEHLKSLTGKIDSKIFRTKILF